MDQEDLDKVNKLKVTLGEREKNINSNLEGMKEIIDELQKINGIGTIGDMLIDISGKWKEQFSGGYNYFSNHGATNLFNDASVSRNKLVFGVIDGRVGIFLKNKSNGTVEMDEFRIIYIGADSFLNAMNKFIKSVSDLYNFKDENSKIGRILSVLQND